MRLGRKNKKTESIKTVQTVLREPRNNSPIFSRFAVQTRTERQLYTTLRESVPIIDAALCKIIRLHRLKVRRLPTALLKMSAQTVK